MFYDPQPRRLEEGSPSTPELVWGITTRFSRVLPIKCNHASYACSPRHGREAPCRQATTVHTGSEAIRAICGREEKRRLPRHASHITMSTRGSNLRSHGSDSSLEEKFREGC